MARIEDLTVHIGVHWCALTPAACLAIGMRQERRASRAMRLKFLREDARELGFRLLKKE